MEMILLMLKDVRNGWVKCYASDGRGRRGKQLSVDEVAALLDFSYQVPQFDLHTGAVSRCNEQRMSKVNAMKINWMLLVGAWGAGFSRPGW